MASVVVKTEIPATEDDLLLSSSGGELDAKKLEELIIRLCEEFSDGITSPDLENRTWNISQEQRTRAINKLLSEGKIELKKLGNTLLFKLKNQETLQKIKGGSPEEILVFSLIEDAGDKGIWVREIASMSNLPRKQLNKILKNLESKKLVKSIKAIGASKRKEVYMLYDVIPHSSLTGGSFYSDQEFDVQFVDALNYQCSRFLKSCAQKAAEKWPHDIMSRKQAACVSSCDMWKHIKDSKMSKVELSEEDVERILDTLVFDGVAEKIPSSSKYPVYRWVESPLPPSGNVRVPCTFCPVFKDCKSGGEISPASCVYFKEWLQDT